MENDSSEWTEATESNIGFLVPDSQLNETDSCQGWDLVSGLSALKDQDSARHETGENMSERKEQSAINPFVSTLESETESDGHAIPLVVDTVSDHSDSTGKESDKNVTVVERVLSTSNGNGEHDSGEPMTATPAQHIASLHLSSEPMLVPETAESFDEVAPSPDAFGSAPMIIPDSPTLDDDAENNNKGDAGDDDGEDDGVVSFKVTQASKTESQSFHLQFTPSQEYLDDDEETPPPARDIVKETTQGQSPLKLRGEPSTSTSQFAAPKPAFHLQKPAAATEEPESMEESERSISVFKRVKIGQTSPQKHRRLRDDSEEFEPLPALSERIVDIKATRSKPQSPRKQLDKSDIPGTSKSSSPSKTAKRGILGKDSSSKSPARGRKGLFEEENSESSRHFHHEKEQPGEGREGLSGVKQSTRAAEGHRQSFPETSIVISEGPDSRPIDEDMTLSYDYHHQGSPSGVSILAEAGTSHSDAAARNEVISSSGDFINPSQKRLPGKAKAAVTVLESDEEFGGFDEPGMLDVSTSKAETDAPSEHHSPQEVTSSRQHTKADADSQNNESKSEVREPSISKVKREKRPLGSQETEDYHTAKPGSTGQDTESRSVRENQLLSLRTGADTVEPFRNQPASLDSDTIKAQVPDVPATKGQIFSEISTVGQSRSLDPYVFHGSESQNLGDISTMPLSDKPYIYGAARGKKRAVKTMRKVLRKKVPSKLDETKSSSTDDATAAKARSERPPLKPRGQAKGRKTSESKPTEAEQEEVDEEEPVQTAFTAIQEKSEFNRPYDLPPAKAGTSTLSHSEPLDNRAGETQQLGKGDGHQEAGDSVKHSKKSATVSFSDAIPAEPPALVRELSDSSEHEVERTTVTRIEKFVVTITERTRVDVFNSKGKLLRSTESTEVSEQNLEPAITSQHTVERLISPQVSPSRSTSTMTTGDLADVSSSSLSRTYSSSSKASNPSLEAVSLSQGLPTPAQRQSSFDGQDKERQQQLDRGMTASTSGVANVMPEADHKRLSTGSNTGQDLFSTPNQSIIDRADSQLGKVVSSSNSTPGSHPIMSPGTVINVPDKGDRPAGQPSREESARENIWHSDTTSPRVPVVVNPSTPQLVEQAEHTVDPSSDISIRGQTTSRTGSTGSGHSETPQRQGSRQGSLGKRLLSDDQENTGDDTSRSKKGASKKRKVAAKDVETKGGPRKQVIEKKSHSRAKEDAGESTDIQSTGFSVHGVPPSTASGDSNRAAPLPVPPSKSSAGISQEVSFQGRTAQGSTKFLVLNTYKSSVVIGAKVMGKWKDGFYYPGVLSKVDQHNKKYMVRFDDGSQSVVKATEIILAAELPVGQSVMVYTDDDDYVPAMVMGHSEASSTAGDGTSIVYHVERDDGVATRCDRGSLILSEDQAVCLLSDEELRITPDAVAQPTSKPADISLENLVQGKRQARATRGSSSREEQPSTSAATTADPGSSTKADASSSARKRKRGPVSTSTPTPTQGPKKGKEEDRGTPVKKPALSPLGVAMSSPSESRRSPRKARTGLFESTTAKKSRLFEGMMFMLTHVEKTAEHRAQEKRLLQDSSLDTSADDNTDIEPEVPPFVKDHIQKLIERGGGTVVGAFDETMLRTDHQCYLVAAEHQRTVKYFQALAAGITIISHQWILESVEQNELQGLKAYILPAGISLEKRKIVEGTKGCRDLSRYTAMVVSSNQEFTDTWTNILNIAKCKVVTRFPARASKNDPGVDIVVSDASCPANIVRRCQQLDVPLVSSEWVAQCLINGHAVEVTGHEKYRHDFID